MLYDQNRLMLIEFDPDLPAPQNRKQRYIEFVSIQQLQGLTTEEIEMLRHDTRAAIRLNRPCDYTLWVWKQQMKSKHCRDYLWTQMQHEYFWSKYNADFWNTGRVSFGEWLKRCRPAQYHALYPRRESLLGVKRWNKRKNRHLLNSVAVS